MTIAAELDRIISAKSDILSAINDKGVSTAGTTSISQCPALINAIQTGGGVTPSSMHSTAATVYQWSGSAEFYITMTQIPVLTFTNPSITASATSWSTSRSGTTISYTAVGWKVAEFDTGILSCDGVRINARGVPPECRPFAANFKPTGSATPSTGTNFVWLGDSKTNSTTSTSAVFTGLYSLSGASILSTASPIYIGYRYKGVTVNFNRLSGYISASGGDLSTALPFPSRDETESDTSIVSAAYSSVFTSGSAASRPGGEYSYLMQGLCSGYVYSRFGNRRFIYPNNTAATAVYENASAVSEGRPGVCADRLYDCIKNHTGYTSTATTETAIFASGDLFSPSYPTSVYQATAWASAITGSAWLGQSSVGHLF